MKNRLVKIPVHDLVSQEDPVSGQSQTVPTSKPSTYWNGQLKYVMSAHMDPSGKYAFVNIEGGQVFTTTPGGHDYIVQELEDALKH